jgi:hypothetical protein
MTHHPFEEWLFLDPNSSEEVLSEQEYSQLHSHLQSCESCSSLSRSWNETQKELRNGYFISPASGFANRWLDRLEMDRQKDQRRQSLALLIISFSAAAILLGMLIWFAWPWVQAPKVFLWTSVYRMVRLYSYIGGFQTFFSAMFQAATSVVPISWFLVSIGIISELAVLWIVSYRILTNPRRLTP